jgi:spore cortex formation protein SpoVR/YcgB (stage V sporulation)
MGLPNRFIHWYWGGTYKELVTQQNKEVFSILEPVLNTVPSHAFPRSRTCSTKRSGMPG